MYIVHLCEDNGTLSVKLRKYYLEFRMNSDVCMQFALVLDQGEALQQQRGGLAM